jgi:hypothetical protein
MLLVEQVVITRLVPMEHLELFLQEMVEVVLKMVLLLEVEDLVDQAPL